MGLNNLNLLKPILYFEDDWYIRVNLMTRWKDGNEVQRFRMQYFYGDYSSLEEDMINIISIANKENARAYIDLVPRRLADSFLRQIEWERNWVYGLKTQCKEVKVPEFYGLYDADKDSLESNELVKQISEKLCIRPLIIKSSDYGQHWIYKRYDLEAIKDNMPEQYRNRFYSTFAWACLYNPFVN